MFCALAPCTVLIGDVSVQCDQAGFVANRQPQQVDVRQLGGSVNAPPVKQPVVHQGVIAGLIGRVLAGQSLLQLLFYLGCAEGNDR